MLIYSKSLQNSSRIRSVTIVIRRTSILVVRVMHEKTHIREMTRLYRFSSESFIIFRCYPYANKLKITLFIDKSVSLKFCILLLFTKILFEKIFLINLLIYIIKLSISASRIIRLG